MHKLKQKNLSLFLFLKIKLLQHSISEAENPLSATNPQHASQFSKTNTRASFWSLWLVNKIRLSCFRVFHYNRGYHQINQLQPCKRFKGLQGFLNVGVVKYSSLKIQQNTFKQTFNNFISIFTLFIHNYTNFNFLFK